MAKETMTEAEAEQATEELLEKVLLDGESPEQAEAEVEKEHNIDGNTQVVDG